MKTVRRVLVLGAEGMVGRIVYTYFKSKKSFYAYGTSRQKKHTSEFFYLNVETAERDLKKIKQKIKGLYAIINCTGILLNQSPLPELLSVNALFPHTLEKFAANLHAVLIHISTDAVFLKNARDVYENEIPSPQDYYGASKFLGETTAKNALTVRTSIIGFHPNKKQGLLEWLKNQRGEVLGFENQTWSGCTNLQFAKFCELLLTNGSFDSLRQKTPVIHFSPIAAKTKYLLLVTTADILKLKVKIKKTKADSAIQRRLRSHFTDFYAVFANDTLTKALREIKDYENTYKTS